MATRGKVRRLPEELPEEAPEDDEPLGAEDLAVVGEGREDATAGRPLTTAELRKALEDQG